MRMIYLESVLEKGVSEDDFTWSLCGRGVLVRMIYLESVLEKGVSEDDLPGVCVGGGW